MLRTILPGTMSDGMYTDSAPKMLSKKLGMQVTQKYPSNLRLITTEYWIADLSSEKEKLIQGILHFYLGMALHCQANFKQLSTSCQAVARQLSGSCPTVVRQLSSGFLEGVRHLSGSCRAVVGQLSGSCRAVVRQLSGSCRVVSSRILAGFQNSAQIVIKFRSSVSFLFFLKLLSYRGSW